MTMVPCIIPDIMMIPADDYGPLYPALCYGRVESLRDGNTPHLVRVQDTSLQHGYRDFTVLHSDPRRPARFTIIV